MGRLLAGLATSLAALVAFSVIVYGMPIEGAVMPIAGSTIMIVVLLGHLWARERREARG